jgi:uncharacterized coiled-coil DUF342 family protein
MNKPYVKQFDKDGDIINPIIGKYESKVFLGTRKVVDEFQQTRFIEMFFPNRQERKNMNVKQHSELYALRDQYLKKLKKANNYLLPLENMKNNIASEFPQLRKIIGEVKSTLGNFLAKFNKAKLAI